jgi:hypothetical protein
MYMVNLIVCAQDSSFAKVCFNILMYYVLNGQEHD